MSVSTDINSCAAALGVLAGQVNEEQWAMLRIVRQNLTATAEQVEHMETSLTIPEPTTTGQEARVE
jgi:hypothetical protein